MDQNVADICPAAQKQDSAGCCRRGKGSNKVVIAIWVTLLLGGVGWLMYSQKQNAMEAERLLNEAQMLYGQRDFAASTECLRQSAELGNAWAQLYYGGSLKNGIGTEQNQAEGVKWLRKSARQKCVQAIYELGVCYENGEGVERDLEEAEDWYRKALDDPGFAPGARIALDRIANLKATVEAGSN